jgi:hypothetical protein
MELLKRYFQGGNRSAAGSLYPTSDVLRLFAARPPPFNLIEICQPELIL